MTKSEEALAVRIHGAEFGAFLRLAADTWARRRPLTPLPLPLPQEFSPALSVLLTGLSSWGKRRRGQREAQFYLAQGYPIRAAARMAGVARMTAARAYDELMFAGFEIRCPCGRVSTHRGWCAARRERSSKS